MQLAVNHLVPWTWKPNVKCPQANAIRTSEAELSFRECQPDVKESHVDRRDSHTFCDLPIFISLFEPDSSLADLEHVGKGFARLLLSVSRRLEIIAELDAVAIQERSGESLEYPFAVISLPCTMHETKGAPTDGCVCEPTQPQKVKSMSWQVRELTQASPENLKAEHRINNSNNEEKTLRIESSVPVPRFPTAQGTSKEQEFARTLTRVYEKQLAGSITQGSVQGRKMKGNK